MRPIPHLRDSFRLPANGLVPIVVALDGVLAQLVERLVRNEKVRGSNPLGSTIRLLGHGAPSQILFDD